MGILTEAREQLREVRAEKRSLRSRVRRSATDPVVWSLENIALWLGGFAPSELRRVGRLGDGWLPSFCTPDDVRVGRKLIEETAESAGREIEDEHYGALVIYTRGDVPPRLAAIAQARRPGVDPTELFAAGREALRPRLEAFVDAGASKFVVVPAFEVDDWTAELEALAGAVLPLQT